MKELFLMRHGKTKENIAHILMGHLDVPVSEEAREEIRSIKPKIIKPDIVFSSDLKRASETTRMLFPDTKIVLMPELRERYYGSLQGKPRKLLGDESIRERPWFQLDGDEDVFKNSGAETLSSVRARVNHVLSLIKKTDAKIIMVLSHGAFISYIVNGLLPVGLINYPLVHLNYHRFVFDNQGNVVEAMFNQSWLHS